MQSYYAEIVPGFYEYGLGFRMRMDGMPTVVWDSNSLKTTHETVCGFRTRRRANGACPSYFEDRRGCGDFGVNSDFFVGNRPMTV